ncbi:MAG TPA: response regulator, partial [Anaeromyxobacteraceae bacterium]|nr:response regulator [Anaeromyxobacteraceae bacterium]
RVRDTGCGMDAATLDRLFEPFFTTKPAGRGTGLGLATVYGIVKQSGGGIWVESEPGRGATFDVCFPRVEEPAPERVLPPRHAVELGAGTILYVEDDAAIRTLAGRVLAEEGYEVLLAATGGEALLLAERHRGRIDLVVSDVVMPGLSGRELRERLRRLLHDTPLLFMSGYGHDAISEHGVLSPDTLFLPKPFTPEALAAKVGEILRQLR